ncbi:MAG: hypothetical protein ACOX3T_05830 [Bdellovibrionota bacterium]
MLTKLKFNKIIFILCTFITASILSSCVNYENYYKLDVNYLARRQFETKRFEAKDEMEILQAALGVLQDLGFTVVENESSLGFFNAIKDREADNLKANQTLDIVMSMLEVAVALSGGQSYQHQERTYDVVQKIYVVLAVSKSKINKGYNVRVQFARIIWNNKDQYRYERILDEKIYQEFFDNLSKSLFLTANDI